MSLIIFLVFKFSFCKIIKISTCNYSGHVWEAVLRAVRKEDSPGMLVHRSMGWGSQFNKKEDLAKYQHCFFFMTSLLSHASASLFKSGSLTNPSFPSVAFVKFCHGKKKRNECNLFSWKFYVIKWTNILLLLFGKISVYIQVYHSWHF